jgi:hypothetical protein
VATSDALPESFDATLGRVLHVDGKEGVALLLTAIVELMSAFGFAGLRSLARAQVTGTPDTSSRRTILSEGASPLMTAQCNPHSLPAGCHIWGREGAD